jgi:3-oxo-5-alpha-steroid 4-dehydrogenase 1
MTSADNAHMSLIFSWLFWGLVVATVFIPVALVFITAPYGKFNRQGWGPVIPGRIAWVVMESFAVFTILIVYLLSPRIFDPVSMVFLLIWESHYVYRTFIFPFRGKGSRRPMPVPVMAMAAVFNIWNGFLNGAWLFFLSPHRELEWLRSWPFITGLVVFMVGMAINQHSDRVLLKLRKTGDSGYYIPHGGMYRWVSVPAYLGEIVEWLGFALLTLSPAALLFACFTAGNLIPRAVSTHRWYLRQFREYPKERRAIIPFIL